MNEIILIVILAAVVVWLLATRKKGEKSRKRGVRKGFGFLHEIAG
ncbi:MAG: hypothetical protein WC587_00230 [Candidatus Paceibacterota bacterium]